MARTAEADSRDSEKKIPAAAAKTKRKYARKTASKQAAQKRESIEEAFLRNFFVSSSSSSASSSSSVEAKVIVNNPREELAEEKENDPKSANVPPPARQDSGSDSDFSSPPSSERVNKLSSKKNRKRLREDNGQVEVRESSPTGASERKQNVISVSPPSTKRFRLANDKDNNSGAVRNSGRRSGENVAGKNSMNYHGASTTLGMSFANSSAAGGGSASRIMDLHNGHSSASNSTFGGSATHVSSSSSASTSGPGSVATKSPSVASLCNLGNTCFLNSVLYTLRFTPGFLHNLHHMVGDLHGHQSQSGGRKDGGGKGKKHANGVANGFIPGVTATSSSGMDNEELEMVFEVIEQLHDLFKSLSGADETSDSSRDPIPPSSFLTAVGRLNPMFEGNQQQDAHELLVMILNILEDIKITPPTPAPAHAEVNHVSEPPPPLPEKKGKGKKSKLSNGLSHNPAIQSAAHLNGSRDSVDSRNLTPSPQPPLQQQQPAPEPVNFVKENFEGKSVMRTRCLECEHSTFRSEAFTNIDVPLTFEDEADADELSGQELFLKQIMMSETLRENNKYWCEECSRLNEAQRSVQFELLPKVMVLQLKRFTAATGSKSSYMSKINDYIPTPFSMSCFCTQCMPHTKAPTSFRHAHQGHSSKPKHHFRLYAVIMHLGATLASGHYIAYVRVSSQMWSEYQQCQRAAQCAQSVGPANGHATGTQERNKANNKKGLLKFLRRKEDKAPPPQNGFSSHHDATDGGNGSGGGSGTCRSAHCCGIRGNLLANMVEGLSLNSHYHQRSIDSTDSTNSEMNSSSHPGHQGGHPSESSSEDDLWLECDDESIQVITRKQFEDLLHSKQGATTPYLLFYQKF